MVAATPPVDVSDLIDYIRDIYDEPIDSSNSHHSDATVIRYINRVLQRVGRDFPARFTQIEVQGDGTANDFPVPFELGFGGNIVMLSNNVPVPRISWAAGLQAVRTTLLTGSIYADYGYSVAYKDGNLNLRITPTLGSGEERTFHCFGGLGNVLETPENNAAGTISSIANAYSNGLRLCTVTATGTEFANATAGDTIYIEDENGQKWIQNILFKVSSSVVLLDGAFQGATATPASASFALGRYIAIPKDWIEMVALDVAWRLQRQERDPEWRQTRADWKQEMWRISAQVESDMRVDSFLGYFM